jgi:hypothetical protein
VDEELALLGEDFALVGEDFALVGEDFALLGGNPIYAVDSPLLPGVLRASRGAVPLRQASHEGSEGDPERPRSRARARASSAPVESPAARRALARCAQA